MPRKRPPRILSLTVGESPMTLHLRWDTGDETQVDLSGHIGAFRLYEPLRRDPALFATARVGEHGVDVAWSDEIDVAADTLWRLAQEQAERTLSAQAFREWRLKRAMTLDAAARALGVSRRMIAYYEQGKRPVPRVVALATRGLDAA